MVKFEEETYLDNVRGALALRGQIEAIVDAAAGQCGNLCWLGIGGTWASCLQTTVHMKERSAMEVFALNAAEYNTTGDRRVGERTFVVISSVTGTTEEMCAAVEKLHAAGARVLGFIDKEDSPLARAVDWCISFPHNEQLKFFMTADRFMFLRGEFKDYDRYYAQLDACLPEGLAAAEKAAAVLLFLYRSSASTLPPSCGAKSRGPAMGRNFGSCSRCSLVPTQRLMGVPKSWNFSS